MEGKPHLWLQRQRKSVPVCIRASLRGIRCPCALIYLKSLFGIGVLFSEGEGEHAS